MKYEYGKKLKVVKCKDFPVLVGRIGTVMFYQDDPTKIKISFDDNWCGYFRPTQLEEINI